MPEDPFSTSTSSKQSMHTTGVQKSLSGPKDPIKIRILHSGSEAQDKGDSRSHGL